MKKYEEFLASLRTDMTWIASSERTAGARILEKLEEFNALPKYQVLYYDPMSKRWGTTEFKFKSLEEFYSTHKHISRASLCID